MLLTMKEKQRLEVMQALMDERLTIEQAAQLLSRSQRQVWRLLSRLRAEGISGIRHKSCERTPWNRTYRREAAIRPNKSASKLAPLPELN